MKLKEEGGFETIHNYIETDSMILRKGAVMAKMWEKLLIPMNMRGGCLVCTRLGNADWNHSAPHGAGRVVARLRKNIAGVKTWDGGKKPTSFFIIYERIG